MNFNWMDIVKDSKYDCRRCGSQGGMGKDCGYLCWDCYSLAAKESRCNKCKLLIRDKLVKSGLRSYVTVIDEDGEWCKCGEKELKDRSGWMELWDRLTDG